MANEAAPVNVVGQVAAEVPVVVAAVEKVDAPLVSQVTISAKTDIGMTVVAAVTSLVGHFGLNWDTNTITVVAGALVIAGPYVAEYALKAYARAKSAV